MKIDNIEDAQPGDWVKAEYAGHPFEGEAWAPEGGSLMGSLWVGGTVVRRADGMVVAGVEIVSIERPEPKLPTEPGSVILDVTTDTGGSVPMMFRSYDSVYEWTDPTAGDVYHDEEIISWTPGKVVPE